MAEAMIDYQNEIEAQSYLEGALEMEKMLNNLTNQNLDSQLNQDFFQDHNNTNNKKAARKKSKPYSNTKVKARNFLTNILHRHYKWSNFKKDNFVVDIFSFLIQNLNPTILDPKFDSNIERDYVKMLLENCVPVQLCKFVYLKDNFTQLCQLQITFQKANDIVKNFIKQDKTNIELLHQHLHQHAVIYQYLYFNLYPKLYSPNNRFGIRNKSSFEYTYRDWYFQKTKHKQSAWKDQTDNGGSNSKNSNAEAAAAAKNPDTYEQRSAADVNEFEQRPEEMKFESSAAAAKPKKVDVTTKAQLDARNKKRKC